jgi:hypothetical protein
VPTACVFITTEPTSMPEALKDVKTVEGEEETHKWTSKVKELQ